MLIDFWWEFDNNRENVNAPFLIGHQLHILWKHSHFPFVLEITLLLEIILVVLMSAN